MAEDLDRRRFQRGTLIHRLMQSLPELPPETAEAAARRYLAGKAHGLDPEEQDQIARETLAVLRHPDFAPLFGPGSRAEVPVVGLIDGKALSGRIDRLVVTGDEVLIIDYKTNRPPPITAAEVAPAYREQLAAYRAALERIYPGKRGAHGAAVDGWAAGHGGVRQGPTRANHPHLTFGRTFRGTLTCRATACCCERGKRTRSHGFAGRRRDMSAARCERDPWNTARRMPDGGDAARRQAAVPDMEVGCIAEPGYSPRNAARDPGYSDDSCSAGRAGFARWPGSSRRACGSLRQRRVSLGPA
ncbi:MAG: PD-(D/E)XK nuclease family protein [Aliidongia sp.]